MRRKSRLSSRSITPLIEIIIVMFFFAFVCTVLLQMFTFSYEKSMDAKSMMQADLLATTFAEQLKGEGEQISSGESKIASAGEKTSYYYDKDWNECERDDAAFVAEIRLDTEERDSGKLLTGTISVFEQKKDSQKLLMSIDYGDYLSQ